MIRGGNEAVDPVIFTDVFSIRVPQFNHKERKYSVVINVLFLIGFLFTHHLFMLPNVRGCTHIYNGTEDVPALRAKARASEFQSYCLRSTLQQRTTYVNANILGFIQLRTDNTDSDVLRMQ